MEPGRIRHRRIVIAELHDLTAAQITQGLSEGEFTTMDVVESFLARVNTYNCP